MELLCPAIISACAQSSKVAWLVRGSQFHFQIEREVVEEDIDK
jgi:hypothetical protein